MKSHTSSRILRTIFCTLLPAALMVFTLSACKDKKDKKVVKKNGLETIIADVNEKLPQALNDEITWTKASIEYSQVRYTYEVSADYYSKLNYNTTRELNKTSMQKDGDPLNKLGKKAAKEGYGIAYIYQDKENENNRITIEFTPEEVKQICGTESDKDEEKDKE